MKGKESEGMKSKYTVRWKIKSKHINKYNKCECISKTEQT